MMTIDELVRGTFLAEIFKFALKADVNELKGAPLFSGNPEGLGEEVHNLSPLEQACYKFIHAKKEEVTKVLMSGASLEDEGVQKKLGLIYKTVNFLDQLLWEDRLIFVNLKDLAEQAGASETVH